ncbi:hypothetical protein CW751_08325 [Brumimicrobium salinarum]|uniref:Uncharacterized protein n=1 Tax=Brumimicrobium salinarum TaxID=2058658 RepID=A0A2I0R2H2_9FLAO|nr:hypothetical protein [Brumimicrobium salinarum]PKR80767.1 hypothetical protein CW751_08325 [Brumimicrobium salinarum]
MPKDIPELEKSTITQIKALTADFKNKFWIQYYITSPLKVFKEMAFHSNLSLYVFQKSFRGHPLMEFLRLLSFIVHALAFLALPFSVFMRKPHYLKSIFSYVLIIYVGYLIFIQRGIEERYTLPILALSLIYLAYFIKTRYSLISKKPNTTPNK